METNGDYGKIVEFCKNNVETVKKASIIELKKIQKDNGFSLANFIKVLQAFGVHALDPQSQQEHEDIFGTSDGFGGHIYGANCDHITE